MQADPEKLAAQLKDCVLGLLEDHVDGLLQEARDEALAEAKAILKRLILQAVVERVLGGPASAESLHGAASLSSPVRTQDDLSPDEEWLTPADGGETAAEAVADGTTGTDRGSVDGCGCYVYGIVSRNDGSPIEGLPAGGVDPDHPVYLLPHRDIQAVVSRVPLNGFGQEQLHTNCNDPAWLAAKVQAHQAVLAQVLGSRAVVPMRFGTIFESESGVEQMLAEHHEQFAKLLGRLTDKAEWGVKIYCDRRVLGRTAEETGPTVREAKAQIGEQSSGMAYFSAKNLREVIAREAERLSDECAQRTHERLSPHAEDAVISPLHGKEITGREEEMILNGAYLVRRDQVVAFRAELGDLAEEYRALGFIHELSGPWPPYNFAQARSGEEASDE